MEFIIAQKLKIYIKRLNIMRRMNQRIVRIEEETRKSLKCLAVEVQKCNAMMKISGKQPIHVVFVCHNPSLWGSLESVYYTILKDPEFHVTVLAVPYRHPVFKDKEFHDSGMAAFLEKMGIEFIQGYDEKSKDWLDLQKLSPDYIFFQTPYESQFPVFYSSAHVSLFARLCYVPYYGTLLYRGIVDETTHPIKFFKNVSYYFVAHEDERKDVKNKLQNILQPGQIIVSGSPKTDYILQDLIVNGNSWKLGLNKNVKRILWTPRWNTSEGNCHFFDYKDYLLDFSGSHSNIDLLFRPHPLCLPNFLKTGELSQAEYDELIHNFNEAPNAKIDFSADYKDTILSADFMISDMSSILYEFFMTGKPIIYTHRVNTFNDFAAKLATGFYWVNNQDELDETLQMLLNGKDPLKAKREQLIEELLLVVPGGASNLIKNAIRNDFYHSVNTFKELDSHDI